MDNEKEMEKEIKELAGKYKELSDLKKKIKQENKIREQDVEADLQEVHVLLKQKMDDAELDMVRVDGYKFKRDIICNPKIENEETLFGWLKEKDMLDGLMTFKRTTFYAAWRKWYKEKKEGGDIEMPPAGTVSVNTYEKIKILKGE